MGRRKFTGEELAKAHFLDLTRQELDEYLGKNKIKYRTLSSGFLATLWRRIKPGKIFFIRFVNKGGVIIMADNEEDACIRSVPFLLEAAHHCKNPRFNKSCDDCNAVFNDLAEKLNSATVTWLGWGCPDYNWVILT